jgi:hypothetical protein
VKLIGHRGLALLDGMELVARVVGLLGAGLALAIAQYTPAVVLLVLVIGITLRMRRARRLRATTGLRAAR